MNSLLPRRPLQVFSDEFRAGLDSVYYSDLSRDNPSVSSGLIWGRKVFVKVYNDLINTRGLLSDSRPTVTGLQARAHAAFFRELANKGFFHPRSRFLVSADGSGRPTVVAIMPALQLIGREEDIPLELYDVPRAVLGAPVASHGDLAKPFNFGLDESGVVRCHDLHVLRRTPSLEVMAWYKRRVNERRARLGMPRLER